MYHFPFSRLITSAALGLGLFSAAPAAALGDRGDLATVFLVAFDYCPYGSVEAAGQLLSIQWRSALFALISANYGGDGRTSFALPDLRAHGPIPAQWQYRNSRMHYCIVIDGNWPPDAQGIGLANLNLEALVRSLAAPAAAPGNQDYLGSVHLIAGNCPVDTLEADGQELTMTENQILASLIWDRYGGDGRTTFALPDLRANVPNDGMHYCIVTSGIYPARDY